MRNILFLLLFSMQTMALSASCSSVYLAPFFNYTRIDSATPSDQEGYMGGIAAGYEYRRSCLFTSLDFEGSWNAGPVTNDSCHRSSVSEYLLAWRIGTTFTKNVCLCSRTYNFQFQPYTGFGYNFFENDLTPSSGGLDYQYNKLFVPLGFHASWCIQDSMRWGIRFEWRPDVYSCLRVASTNLDLKLKHAFRLEAPFEIDTCFCYGPANIQIIPFFDWNEFGRVDESSSNGNSVNLNHLTRWNLGLQVGLSVDY